MKSCIMQKLFLNMNQNLFVPPDQNAAVHFVNNMYNGIHGIAFFKILAKPQIFLISYV